MRPERLGRRPERCQRLERGIVLEEGERRVGTRLEEFLAPQAQPSYELLSEFRLS